MVWGGSLFPGPLQVGRLLLGCSCLCCFFRLVSMACSCLAFQPPLYHVQVDDAYGEVQCSMLLFLYCRGDLAVVGASPVSGLAYLSGQFQSTRPILVKGKGYLFSLE